MKCKSVALLCGNDYCFMEVWRCCEEMVIVF